ncbi:8-oxo-dGTP diphosphatase MutT [Henriciella mobilis]|uniref:8-oxo-dGTP diphosphatase n=1 Tax=Henriciella mobilis TaxID=2305467 RepID=A0A399RIA3_9PROT|nr:8-oxo-dGTP diphosphatase MutT [Henriciella mobilis]RIJ17983.1 8-oxo-dGTP diphosphatase MutT [Henriciella mobilis]RIJ25209.1 8-oxo-dGTP diphosphatase MutT [Henriciella mobilis]RIJ30273.1 8-oxo-dGTP diphosphatase MutT [Henriciella mobilis]
MTKPLVFVVAAALMDAQDRVLLARRPEGKSMAGLWEFPGGKVESGETPEAALCRELKEELQVEAAPGDLQSFNFASFDYPKFHLFMPLYILRVWKGEPVPLEGQAIEWVKPTDLKTYPAPPADIPLFEALSERF